MIDFDKIDFSCNDCALMLFEKLIEEGISEEDLLDGMETLAKDGCFHTVKLIAKSLELYTYYDNLCEYQKTIVEDLLETRYGDFNENDMCEFILSLSKVC